MVTVDDRIESAEDESRLDSVETENKLLEDAIAEGLARLGITREEAEIEVLDEGKKGGFLGIGGKNARVRVSRVNSADKVISNIISNLAELLDDSVSVTSIKKKDGRYYCEIDAENVAILLGRRGKTLDALQVLVSSIAARKLDDRIKVTLDACGFREKRKDVLAQIAQEASKEAIKYGQRVHLEPMSAHDRKVIHAVLSNSKEVSTISEDSGDRRHIIIVPKEMASRSSGREGRERDDRRDDRDDSRERRPRGRGRREGSSRDDSGARREGRGRGGRSRRDDRDAPRRDDNREKPTEQIESDQE